MYKYFALLLCLCFLTAVRAQVSCVTCDASSNNDCITNPAGITAESCSSNTCFTQIVNGLVSRGCTSALPEDTTCTGANCVTCAETNCNAKQTICQSCVSNTETTCATLSATNNLFNSICTISNSQCFVGVSNSITTRRCAEATDECPADSTTCNLCTGSNCNNRVFPEAEPAPTATTAKVTTVTATTVRGTTPAGSTVPGSTAAGTAPVTMAPTGSTINCIECTSDKNANCLRSPASIIGTACPGKVCYEAWVDNVYNRGCLSTAVATLSQLCSGNSEQCKTCTTNLCNVDLVNSASINQQLTISLVISAALIACRNLI